MCVSAYCSIVPASSSWSLQIVAGASSTISGYSRGLVYNPGTGATQGSLCTNATIVFTASSTITLTCTGLVNYGVLNGELYISQLA